jgi:hypothetical protein
VISSSYLGSDASEAATFIIGQVIVADGGVTIL